MKPLNYPKIKKQKGKFYIMFFVTFAFMFGCLFITLMTADKGAAELEQKHKYYNNIVVKQGEMNLLLDEILIEVNDLRFKDRTLNERKYLQSLINEKRLEIKNEIRKSKTDLTNSFSMYEEFLVELQRIQTRIDVLKEDETSYNINKVQLEKCIEKHNKENIKK
ncbi:type VI secretion system TssO [Flavobacterium artemisiae]|uniref:Type VI secretion system TssO n=1 Tax=Flavobacterium artemisiae TaxID=2126556 RepID=A0ABW4HG27_9FLAO